MIYVRLALALLAIVASLSACMTEKMRKAAVMAAGSAFVQATDFMTMGAVSREVEYRKKADEAQVVARQVDRLDKINGTDGHASVRCDE